MTHHKLTNEGELREKIDHALHVDWAFGTHHGDIANQLNNGKPDKIIVQGYPKGAYHTSYKMFVDNMIQLLTSEIEKAKVELINELNKKIFFSSVNPDGQYIKDCLMEELSKLQEEQK